MSAPSFVDLHVHSDFSDGEASPAAIIGRAAELGLEALALTDHYDAHDPEHPCPGADSLLAHFDRSREVAQRLGVRLLCGVETCAGPEGELRLEDRVRAACDIVIASPHYVESPRRPRPGDWFDPGYWEAYKRKVLRMAGSGADVLGHCEGYLPFAEALVPGTTTYEGRQALAREVAARFFDEGYVVELARAARSSGVAVELHCATMTPRESVIDRLVDAGVKVSIGSDAHTLDAVGRVGWAMEMIRKRGAGGSQYLPQAASRERKEGC